MMESLGGPAHPSQPGLADGLTGSAAIVQAGLDAAKQTLFSAADVPLASADELLAAVSGPALKAVLEMRIEQIVRHGHCAENDRLQPIGMLVREAHERAQAAKDCLWGERRNLKVARRRMAVAAALLLAAIDRLDFEAALEPAEPVRGTGEHGSPQPQDKGGE